MPAASAATRPPAVAGHFYPADANELRTMVREYLDEVDAPRGRCRAAVVPHAGLVYSGRCAAQVFARVALPPLVVIVAPNHTGTLGARGGASVWARGAFATPLGDVPVAHEFVERLAAQCDLVAHDPPAHAHEHAVEIELPFLQVCAPETAIVPLVLAWDDWRRCEVLGQALASVAREWPEGVLLLASSDMTHHEPAEVAARKDRAALQAVERMDGATLLATCRRERITMCGRAPAAAVIEAARLLGATGAEVVDYRHSGWVTGDDDSVVAYAGVLVH